MNEIIKDVYTYICIHIINCTSKVKVHHVRMEYELIYSDLHLYKDSLSSILII